MADARPQDEQIATDLAKNDQIESSQALPTERRRDSPNPKASPQQTPEPPTSPTAPHEQLSQAERGSILEDNLLEAGSQGGHVETRSATEAVVVYGRPVNHVLHLLLSVFTCGLWVPVWLFIAATGGQHRATICVDPEGTVSETNAPIGPAKPLLWTAIELWLLCMIVVFSVVVRSCSAAFSDHPVSSSSTTTHTKIPTPTMSMPTGIVPEARDGKFAFVITNITTAPTLTWGVALESESQTAQGNFVIVSMTVGNTSSTEYGFFADDQRLVDTAGSQIKSSFDQSDRTKTFFTTSPSPVYLGPGERVKVDLAFDVAPGQQAKRMVLHDSSLSRGVGVNLPPY
jgi:hypothetical protein